tara:strand:- start:1256 stop:2152 length:897 start_codon:yes stop_codon:yes gene_type:complete
MSDIALDDVELITFPDGQTHISLKNENLKTVHPVDIRCSIRSPDELFKLLMVGNVLDSLDVESRLHIKYLMGARMDRAIDQRQPFTLKLVCDMINNGFPNSPVTVFCPHSEAVSLLLKNYKGRTDQEKNFYYRVFEQVINRRKEEITGGYSQPFMDRHGIREDELNEYPLFDLIIPDAGAGKRWYNTFASYFSNMTKSGSIEVVECSKKRDMATGKLSGFKVPQKVKKHCLILDDLCDGGRTFVGLAEKLREQGAKTVELAVCHGIFSYGYDLKGIDKIYTTNSYAEHKSDNLWSYRV